MEDIGAGRKKKCGDSLRGERSLFQAGDGGATPTSPLQLEIIEISAKKASYMNELWHSRLPRIDWSNIVRNTHYACYGAHHNGRWYAVGIWSSPVAQNRMADGKTVLELRRLAICDDAPKNTATRMLGVMRKLIAKKFPDIKKLISYQDTEVHEGTIYKADNWNRGRETPFLSWNTENRKRSADQSKANKTRWEYKL